MDVPSLRRQRGERGQRGKKETKAKVTFLHARTRVVILAEGDGENLSTCSLRLRSTCCKPWMEAHSGARNWPSMGSEEAVPSPAVSRTSPSDGPGPPSPAVTERRTRTRRMGSGDESTPPCSPDAAHSLDCRLLKVTF